MVTVWVNSDETLAEMLENVRLLEAALIQSYPDKPIDRATVDNVHGALACGVLTLIEAFSRSNFSFTMSYDDPESISNDEFDNVYVNGSCSPCDIQN